MNTEQQKISDIAHAIWINEGMPDGEQIIETHYGPMKLKEKHWMEATHNYIVDLWIEYKSCMITASEMGKHDGEMGTNICNICNELRSRANKVRVEAWHIINNLPTYTMYKSIYELELLW